MRDWIEIGDFEISDFEIQGLYHYRIHYDKANDQFGWTCDRMSETKSLIYEEDRNMLAPIIFQIIYEFRSGKPEPENYVLKKVLNHG